MTTPRPRFARAATLGFLALTYFTQAGYDACSGDLLHDDGFDLWCGDALCSWQVEAGDVAKAPTWNPGDLGVELVGEAAISQRSDVSDAQVDCVRFSLVADIAEDASVTLEMDLLDDGSVDFSRELPTANWAPLIYKVQLPVYNGIRFRLTKRGAGRAVVAQIAAHADGDCDGAPAIDQPILPAGAGCGRVGFDGPARDAVCASGRCVSDPDLDNGFGVCGACETSAECDGDAVCGLDLDVAPALEVPHACVAPADKTLGERCADDGECTTGVCCDGVCSSCCTGGRGCAGGATCVRHDDGRDELDWYGRPIYVCAGAPAGAACLDGSDCGSGACRGGDRLDVCLADGRHCDEDPDCPPDLFSASADFGTCLRLGRRGTCD